VQRRDRLAARLIAEQKNIVTLAVCRPETNHAVCAKPALVGDPADHGDRIFIEAARRGGLGVIEDRRKFSGYRRVPR
jgi:hypothetical protein